MHKLMEGDCLIKLKELEDNSVDSIITDPPYELGFMGKSWDSTGVACIQNGYDFIGIDMTPEYIEISKARIERAEKEAGNKLLI